MSKNKIKIIFAYTYNEMKNYCYYYYKPTWKIFKKKEEQNIQCVYYGGMWYDVVWQFKKHRLIIYSLYKGKHLFVSN